MYLLLISNQLSDYILLFTFIAYLFPNETWRIQLVNRPYFFRKKYSIFPNSKILWWKLKYNQTLILVFSPLFYPFLSETKMFQTGKKNSGRIMKKKENKQTLEMSPKKVFVLLLFSLWLTFLLLFCCKANKYFIKNKKFSAKI